MLYTERYTYYYASLKIACQMEVRKAVKTVGIYWLSIGLVLGYSTGRRGTVGLVLALLDSEIEAKL